VPPLDELIRFVVYADWGEISPTSSANYPDAALWMSGLRTRNRRRRQTLVFSKGFKRDIRLPATFR